jgi:tRNA (adenine22-N1)-methyltransferase
MIPRGARVADVGAGHGLLCAWLLARRRCSVCYATDRDPAVVDRLRRPGAAPGLEARLGDGLRALRRGDRPSVIVISGLGARSILRLLARAGGNAARVERLVLQPQTEAGRLRRRLVARGWSIEDERMVRDRDRLYVVIAADRRRSARPPVHERLAFDDLMEVGPCLVRSGDPLVREHWRRTRDRLDRVLARATPGRGRAQALRGRSLAERILAVLDAAGEATPARPERG